MRQACPPPVQHDPVAKQPLISNHSNSNPLGTTHLTTIAPLDYRTPPFPSLYWPFPIKGPQSYYLYYREDIWRFTAYWTLLFYGVVHGVTAGYAVVMQAVASSRGSRSRRRSKSWGFVWFAVGVPALYLFVGGVEALIAGSVVGGLLGSVYNAGYFQMSTWIPFVWALICALALILSSFAIQGGL